MRKLIARIMIVIWFAISLLLAACGDYPYAGAGESYDVLETGTARAVENTYGEQVLQASQVYVGRHFNFRPVGDVTWRVEPSPGLDFRDIRGFSDGLAVFTDHDNNRGAIDRDGNIVIPPMFRHIDDFINDVAVAYNQDNLAGVIDREGNVVVPFEYSFLASVTYGSRFIGTKMVGDANRYGVIGRNGDILIPFEFDWIQYASYGMFGIVQEDKFGFAMQISEDQTVSLPYDIDTGFWQHGPPFAGFSEWLAPVAIQDGDDWRDRRYGVINTRGEIVVPFYFDWIGLFNDGLAPVMLNDLYGFIDSEGNIIIEIIYSWVQPFSEGLAVVGLGDRSSGNMEFGYIDRNGDMIISPRPLKFAGPFSEGLAAVVLPDGAGGFINIFGEMAIPAKFGVVEHVYRVGDIFAKFDRGLAVVGTADPHDRLYGVIDRSGNIILPFEYTYVRDFSYGLAMVWTWDREDPDRPYRYGFINHNGEFILSMDFENATSFSEGLAAVQQDGLWGIVEIG